MTTTRAAGSEVPREREVWNGRLGRFCTAHPIWAVFIVALAVRVVLAVGIAFLFPAGVFGDDTTYSALAQQMQDGISHRWGAYVHTLYRMTFTFTGPLTALYWLLWPAKLFGQLYVAVLGASAAAATAAIGLRFFRSSRWAIVAGLGLALLPSQVLFSSLILKDAPVWAVMAALGLVMVQVPRESRWKLARLGIAGALLLFSLGYLRNHTTVVATWALVIASWPGRPDIRWWRRAGAVLVGVLIPIQLGLGPLGMTFALNAGSLDERRAGMAQNARTRFVDPDAESGGISTDLRHLPKGVAQMLVEPLPWRKTDNNRVQLARAETVVWYPILGLALLGSAIVIRRRQAELYFLVLVGAATTIMYGLSEGNFGTAFRHRGELGWLAMVLATVAIRDLVIRRSTRSTT